MAITSAQIHAMEDIASQIYDDQISVQDGLKILINSHQINQNSALMYIQNYKAMLEGKVLKRSISAEAFDYFLSKILEKRGVSAHKIALESVEQHIEYLENHNGSEMHKVRAVLDEHLKRYMF